MDSLVAFKGKDYIIMAADTYNAYSVLRLKAYDDKIWNLDGEKLMAIGGQHSDILRFGDYIQKNLAFMQYKNGQKLSIDDTAMFVRHQLAQAIRKGPYMVNCLLAGFQGDKPRLYWHDYLGSVVQLNKAAHGYAQYFVSSTMDTLQTKDMNFQQGLELMKRCLNQIQTRFMIGQSSFVIKAITKDGIKIIQDVQKPQGA